MIPGASVGASVGAGATNGRGFMMSAKAYCCLADLVVVVHLAWFLFVVLGLVVILVGARLRWRWVRNFWFRMVHLLMIGIVVVEAIGGVICPLTDWERQLRRLGGEQGEPGSFVGRLVNRLLFFDWPEWVFRVLHIAFGAAVFLAFLLAPPRWPWRKDAAEPG